MQPSRVFIMGSGVVGSATGEGFLAAGHDVTFIDLSAFTAGTASVGKALAGFLLKDTQGFLGFADDIDVDMPLLSAVVETDGRLAAIVNHEVDTVTHAAERPEHEPA